MSETSAAAEHLRVIRVLMERATIYRAISAPTALVGGLLSFLTAAVLVSVGPSPGGEFGGAPRFIVSWLSVLLLTGAANAWFIWRDARSRGDVFFSPGMRMALRALSPGLLAGGAFTFCFYRTDAVFLLPAFWMIFYGLGLLSTWHFAPRSIGWLGWAFFAAGICFFLGDSFHQGFGETLLFGDALRPACVRMAATFGLFHVVYAVCTGLRSPGGDDVAEAA